MNQIMLMLGLDARGLFGNLKRGSDSVKEFERDWNGLRKLFGAGGLTFLVTGFFDAMITRAREAKGAMSENEAAVHRFGTAMEEGKKGASDWGVTILGSLNRIGEWFGNNQVQVNEFWRTLWGAADSANGRGGFVAFKEISALWKQAGVTAKNRSDQVAKADAQERQTAEFKKKFGEDSTRLTAQLEASEKRRTEIQMKGLTTQEQVNARENEYNRLVAEREAMTGTVLQKREQDLKVSEAKNALLSAEIDLSKEQAQISKKGFDEDLEWVKQQDKARADLKKAQFEALDLDQQTTALTKEQAALTAQIAKAKRAGTDTTALEAKLQETTNDLGKKKAESAERTAEAEKKARKDAEGHAEAAKRTQQAYESIIFGLTNGGASSEQIQASSDSALKELQRRNNNRLLMTQQGARVGPAGGEELATSFNLLRLQNENARIKRELDTRNSIRRDVNNLGVEGARRQFQGDPLIFDRLVSEFATTQTETKKTNQLLQTLITRIGPDAAGNLPSSVASLNDTMRRGLDALGQRINDLRRN